MLVIIQAVEMRRHFSEFITVSLSFLKQFLCSIKESTIIIHQGTQCESLDNKIEVVEAEAQNKPYLLNSTDERNRRRWMPNVLCG